MPNWYPWVNVVLIAAALTCYLLAWRRRTPECPGMTLNPRNWKPVWKMHDWFTPAGYRYNLVATACLGVAGIVAVLALLN